jgi:hypothetical protein
MFPNLLTVFIEDKQFLTLNACLLENKNWLTGGAPTLSFDGEMGAKLISLYSFFFISKKYITGLCQY